MGNDGYLMESEVWLYVFDSALMFLVIAVFNIIHPSEVKGLLKGYRASRWIVRMQTMKKISDIEDSTEKDSKPVEYRVPDIAHVV